MREPLSEQAGLCAASRLQGKKISRVVHTEGKGAPGDPVLLCQFGNGWKEGLTFKALTGACDQLLLDAEGQVLKELPAGVVREMEQQDLRQLAADDDKEEVTPDFSGKRVLLVEDNQMNQILAENILTGVGLAVDIASDGTEAVEKMKSATNGYYDIILMDIQMPEMDGYEATRQIRALDDKEKSNIPIVAVTANAFDEDRKISREVGMNGHLAKPYDIPEIMKTLNKLLN